MATGGADAPIDIIEISDDSEDNAMEVEEKETASEPPEYVHTNL